MVLERTRRTITTAALYPAASLLLITALTAAAQTAPPRPASPPTGAAAMVPQIALAPGLNTVPDYKNFPTPGTTPKVPEGFTPIFNGKDLTGWHASKVARHGATPDFHVAHGIILGAQNPLGRGGLLLTDKKYRNFEFYMEAKADYGDDSGFFFRCTEEGAAYQVTMDFLPGGSMGRLIQEGGLTLKLASTTPPPTPGAARPPDPGMTAWKHEDWNAVRIRVEGDNPHVTVWINGQQISDAQDTQNSAVGGMLAGSIAIQIHGGTDRWLPGGFWRWRNLAIKELPTN
jgi:hypothetical protein